jgi:ABC-2 type transport system ATP-binding protein
MMHAGELIALASPDELRAELPGTLIQVDCAGPARAFEVLEAMPGILEMAIHGARLHVSLAEPGQVDELQARLSRGGIAVRSLSVIQPSLEDIFLYMVQQRQPTPAHALGE